MTRTMSRTYKRVQALADDAHANGWIVEYREPGQRERIPWTPGESVLHQDGSLYVTHPLADVNVRIPIGEYDPITVQGVRFQRYRPRDNEAEDYDEGKAAAADFSTLQTAAKDKYQIDLGGGTLDGPPTRGAWAEVTLRDVEQDARTRVPLTIPEVPKLRRLAEAKRRQDEINRDYEYHRRALDNLTTASGVAMNAVAAIEAELGALRK